MKPDLTPYLGQRVQVRIDRPLGSVHPRYPDSEPYPLNYGFIPGTLSGDGHPVDAYVLGIHEPAREVEGVVIAIIARTDDTEDKLVVSADGRRYTSAEIEAAVAFQERYFQTTIHAIMWQSGR